MRLHLELLLLWNRRAALVSQLDPLSVAQKHFLDSLAVAPLCAQAERLVDIGSGAGFPGLPVAVIRPDCSVSLLDSNRKKISFLLEVVARTGVTNARVVEGRAEELALQEHRSRYSIATSRAFSALDTFLALARPFLEPRGRAVAMKGPNYEPELQGLSLDPQGYSPPAIHRYELPDGARRALLIFQRTD